MLLRPYLISRLLLLLSPEYLSCNTAFNYITLQICQPLPKEVLGYDFNKLREYLINYHPLIQLDPEDPIADTNYWSGCFLDIKKRDDLEGVHATQIGCIGCSQSTNVLNLIAQGSEPQYILLFTPLSSSFPLGEQ